MKIGDRVTVKPGKAHDAMTRGKTGTVVEISTPALGIKFEGISKIHKWYVAEELERDVMDAANEELDSFDKE